MEATGDEGLLKTIRPPRLEDAGLEDCALSDESIKEAFLKAANSIRSRASSILITTAEDEEDDSKSCIQDPGPSDGKLSDTLVGISPEAEPPGPCGNEKGGGLPQSLGADVVVAGVADSLSDEEGRHCVDELQGLKIKEDVDHKDYDDEQDNRDEGPILAETYV
ncbi:uncharacterized protein LOC122671562 isoform X2 [Telopea speciosissima]|uniref:uncharacterized protein LOC122671562 isoform X2 n=1 Tax=Telopea speciosissima TaxID=54955 RepID=UPI001CC42636|nr:uncharacterized protein LOC122671562 isoform X2 [Telopea speciosissima]